MVNQKSHHVVTNPNSGWDIKKGGVDRATKHCDKKQEAIEKACGISRNQGTELYIHGRDGKIQQKDSLGNDPFPSQG